MAFYTGKVKRQDLLDTIIQHLTTTPEGATDPYWTAVQSGAIESEGAILYSQGSSGEDDIYVRFAVGDDNYFRISILESYTPNSVQGLSGTIENETYQEQVYWMASTVHYHEHYPVSYLLSFDQDKIMLMVEGNKTVHSANWMRTFMWAGVPKPFSTEDKKARTTLAVSAEAYSLVGSSSSAYGNFSVARTLKNRKQEVQQNYWMRTINTFKTKGWGGHLFLPDIYLECVNNEEGIRGLMDGVHPIYPDNEDVRNGDEITVGSKRYTIIECYNPYSDYNCFPSDYLAVEQLQ